MKNRVCTISALVLSLSLLVLPAWPDSPIAPPPGAPTAPEKDSAAVPPKTTGTDAASDESSKPPPEVLRDIARRRASDAKVEALRAASLAHPEEIRYQLDLLQGLIDLGRIEEALEVGPLIVGKFPGSKDPLLLFGRALMRDGKFPLASAQFEKAIAIDPEDARARAQMARVELIRGNLKNAEAGLRKALSLDPTLQEARSDLAVLLERSERYAEAGTLLAGPGGQTPAPDVAHRRSRLLEYAKTSPYLVPRDFTRVSVPMLTARGYPPMVRAKSGEAELLLVLDTSAEDTILTSAAARRLGLPEKGKEFYKDEAGKLHETPAYTFLEQIGLGTLTVKKVPVRVSPGLRYPGGDQIAGSLGRGFLRRFRVILDYPEKTFALASAEGPPLEGVPFDLMSVILLDGMIKEESVGPFVLDTSSYTPGSLDIEFVATQTGINLFSKEVKPMPEGGPYLFQFTMPTLKVAGVTFADYPATAVDLRGMAHSLGVNVRGVIGHSYLRGCRLEIDFKNQRLALRRAAEAARTPTETGS